jgi:hypothetical protein
MATPGVSLGIFATVLFVLRMTERLENIADASHDLTGLDLAREKLPKRISSPREKARGMKCLDWKKLG